MRNSPAGQREIGCGSVELFLLRRRFGLLLDDAADSVAGDGDEQLHGEFRFDASSNKDGDMGFDIGKILRAGFGAGVDAGAIAIAQERATEVTGVFEQELPPNLRYDRPLLGVTTRPYLRGQCRQHRTFYL